MKWLSTLRYFPRFHLGPYYIFFDWKVWGWSRHDHFYPTTMQVDAHLDSFQARGPTRIRRLWPYEFCTRDSTYGLITKKQAKSFKHTLARD
jgi:hypothetical protein